MSNAEQTASDRAMHQIQHEGDIPSPVASSDMLDDRTASDDITHPTREKDLQPEILASSNIPTSQPISQVSTPVSLYRCRGSYILILPCDKLPLDPLNVFFFGETRVDKRSIIDLLVGQNIADTVLDAPHPMLKHIADIILRGRRFQLWEFSSIALMGFLQRFIAKWRLRASYRKLYRNGGAPLLLYCMRGPSAPTASRDYQDFTGIVGSTGHLSIVAVVNGLEESLTNMDDWWTKHKGDLERLGMQFSNHACISSLPDDPSTSQSRETIRNLIETYVS
jgi:hypothetical protein